MLSAKHAKFKDTKKALFVNTPVRIALVKLSTFLYFSFVFWEEIPNFREIAPNQKNGKLPKQRKQQ